MKNKTFFSTIFILLVVILSKAVIFSNKYKSDDYHKNYSVFIHSKKNQTENMVSYNVYLGNKFNDKFVMKIYDSEKLNLLEYTNLKYGDVISIKGKIVVPEYMNNPGEFNYKNYLYSNNIYGEITVKEINEKEVYRLTLKEKVISYIYRYKEYMGNILITYMDKENVELAKSIIYGETTNLDEEIQSSFEETGLSHLMAISGANITSILSVLSVIFLSLKIKGKFGKIVTLIVVVLFVILSGSSLSTIRAGIMCTTTILVKLLNKKIHPLKSWLLAMVVILLYAPYSICNTGCVLSFLATFGILTLLQPLIQLTRRVTDSAKIIWVKKIVEGIFLNLWLVVAIYIMILPVQINSFNLISPTQIIFNILVSGITNIITILGALFILFSYIPIINCLTVKTINICISILMWCINIFKRFSLNIQVMDLPLLVVILYYCIIFSFLIKIYLKDFVKNRKYAINKKAWKKYYIIQTMLWLLTLIILITNSLYFKYIDSFVYFFNVGQGEMSYIKSGENSVIVDIGSLKSNLAFNTISNYFKMKNITGVDAIVISHMHTDHINGLEKYLENYKVGIILYSKQEETETYIKFKEMVEKHDVNIKEVIVGEIYNFGDICIEILLPDKKLLEVENSVNANSLICKITVKGKNIMYMGDGTLDTEERLLELYDLNNVDILKVGHHGSKTATSEEYIKKLLPSYAVISAKKSYYNHPHESVVQLLKKYNVKIYITEKVGAIKFNMYNL